MRLQKRVKNRNFCDKYFAHISLLISIWGACFTCKIRLKIVFPPFCATHVRDCPDGGGADPWPAEEPSQAVDEAEEDNVPVEADALLVLGLLQHDQPREGKQSWNKTVLKRKENKLQYCIFLKATVSPKLGARAQDFVLAFFKKVNQEKYKNTFFKKKQQPNYFPNSLADVGLHEEE